MNKPFLIFLGLTAALFMYFIKRDSGAESYIKPNSVAPDGLTNKSDMSATSTILDWFRTHPQAASAMDFSGLLDVSTNGRYVPMIRPKETMLTSANGDSQPVFASLLQR